MSFKVINRYRSYRLISKTFSGKTIYVIQRKFLIFWIIIIELDIEILAVKYFENFKRNK